MPLNFVDFFSPSRFFSLRPAIDIRTVYFLLIFFGLLIAIGIVLGVLKSSKKISRLQSSVFGRYANMFLTLGIVGEVLVWFRYERVSILSARFWLFIWFVGLIVWLVFILKFQLKKVPEIMEKSKQRREFEKYLPKKK